MFKNASANVLSHGSCICLYSLYFFFFFCLIIFIFSLMVICNSPLLLKSLPINVIDCIKFYVNCSVLTGTGPMIGNANICLFVC